MPDRKAPARDARFWLSPDERAGGPRYQIIDGFVDSVRQWHQTRHQRYFKYLDLYGVDYSEYGRGSVDPLSDEDLAFNICEPIVDTAVNKICKSRVVPMALTTGGTYRERRRAKNFNRLISGLFMESDAFDKDYTWTSDAFIGDIAIAKIIEKDERVLVERCDPTRVWWDPEEAHLTSEVTVIVEDHPIDRYKLLELLEEWEEQGKLLCTLDEAQEKVLAIQYDDTQNFFRRPSQHDVVLIREAWHSKSSKRSDDGRHVICLPGTLDLVAEDYDSCEVPHIFLTRKRPMFGLTSPGLMAGIAAGQMEHNKVTERIRIGQDCAPPRLIIRKGGSVTPGSLTDIPGDVLEAEDPGSDVVQFNAQPVHPDIYAYRKDIVADMQLTSSVPEMSMNGKPPDGVTAARALATLDDTVAEKLSQPLRMREAFFVKIGERMLELVGRIAKRHRGKYIVRAENGRTLETLNWKDVAIPIGSYRLKCFPTNFLSQTPSVRYERLSEMHSNGEISELEFRALSEIPDLESDNDLETAPQDIVDMCIDAILVDGKPIVAESFDDHALIVQRGMKAYNMARCQAPDPNDDAQEFERHKTRLKLLANYINSARNWLMPPKPSPTVSAAGPVPTAGPVDQGPMGMMPPPGGPPMPPPPGAAGPPPNPFGPPMGEIVSNGMA